MPPCSAINPSEKGEKVIQNIQQTDKSSTEFRGTF